MNDIRRFMRISRREPIRNEEIKHGDRSLIMDNTERKQLVYGYVQRVDGNRLPRQEWLWKKRRKRGRTREMGYGISERDLAEEQWNNRQQWQLNRPMAQHVLTRNYISYEAYRCILCAPNQSEYSRKEKRAQIIRTIRADG